MKLVALERTRLTVRQLAEMAKKEPVILTQDGKPLTSVKDMSGSDWESVSLAQNPQFIAIIEESRRSYKEKGGIRLEDLRKELGIPSRRKRAGTRAKKQSRDAR